MPRKSNTENNRATIAKLRAHIAHLEAKLASTVQNPATPDLTGWTLDERMRTYAPTREEAAALRAELVERLTVFGRNTGTLSEDKVRALPRDIRGLMCGDLPEHYNDENWDFLLLEADVPRAFMDSFLVPRRPRKKVHFKAGDKGFPLISAAGPR